MQTAMCMLSTVIEVIKCLVLQLFAPYIITESVESHHSYCPNGDKTWCHYHKDKIFNRNIYDRSKCFTICVSRRASCQRKLTQTQNESINNMIWSKCPKRVHVARADLLFLFVNEMK